jgi:hypothetical protein
MTPIGSVTASADPPARLVDATHIARSGVILRAPIGSYGALVLDPWVLTGTVLERTQPAS